MEISNDNQNYFKKRDLIQEEDEDENFNNFKHFKKNYNYNNNNYLENEDDEDPIVAQYKLHLEKCHMNRSPVKELIKSKARSVNTVISNKIEHLNHRSKVSSQIFRDLDAANEKSNLNNSIEKSNENFTYAPQEDDDTNMEDNFNKSNERNNNTKENKIFANPRFSSIIDNLKN